MIDGRKIQRSLIRVLQLVVIAYLLVLVAVLIFQRRLIYFPTKIPADVIEAVATGHGFLPWKNALGCDYLARPIHEAAAVDVFVLEYPGYGARGGSPGKASFIAAAEAAFEMLPKNRPRYVVSESIGAGVACELAQRHPAEIAGLALFAPYQNFAAVAQRQMPVLPAYFLLRDRFNPAACLQNYRGPVEFIVAGADEIIAPRFGQGLFDGYGGPKNLQLIPGARHNEIAEQTPVWWREVFAYWRRSQNPA